MASSDSSHLSSLIVNPRSLETRITHRFLRSLVRLQGPRFHHHIHSSPSFSMTGRRIKAAAYTSMASAATIRNPNRLWARALLFKMRSRRLRVSPFMITARRNKRSSRRRGSRSGRRVRNSGSDDEMMMKKKKLGELVPGGECMEFCTLLEEAADYIKYLTAQISVMQAVADALTDA